MKPGYSPGCAGLRGPVLHGFRPLCLFWQKPKNDELSLTVRRFSKTGNFLLSQAVAHQVSSAFESLTSVFEMGTGGSSQLLSPDIE